jgi:Arc/MetJ-type ribon-helix-helix transcriptional regulator
LIIHKVTKEKLLKKVLLKKTGNISGISKDFQNLLQKIYILQCSTMPYMETISLRFQKNIIQEMDFLIKERSFNSRTEFIREAVRDKITDLNKDELIKEFLKLKGKSKIKTTLQENAITKKKVSKELLSELEKRFS